MKRLTTITQSLTTWESDWPLTTKLIRVLWALSIFGFAAHAIVHATMLIWSPRTSQALVGIISSGLGIATATIILQGILDGDRTTWGYRSTMTALPSFKRKAGFSLNYAFAAVGLYGAMLIFTINTIRPTGTWLIYGLIGLLWFTFKGKKVLETIEETGASHHA